MVALDDVFKTEHINFLKVDTEGFDTLVLYGAQTLLREQRIDTIVYECHSLQRLEEGHKHTKCALFVSLEALSVSPLSLLWLFLLSCSCDFACV